MNDDDKKPDILDFKMRNMFAEAFDEVEAEKMLRSAEIKLMEKRMAHQAENIEQSILRRKIDQLNKHNELIADQCRSLTSKNEQLTKDLAQSQFNLGKSHGEIEQLKARIAELENAGSFKNALEGL